MENTESTTQQKINTVIFFSVSGYCLSRQLFALYKAWIELKKARRNTDNSYMNLITSIEDRDIV
jgi:hypothetical protein